MKILISGVKGFIGSPLRAALEKEGHQLVALTRETKGASLGLPEINWNPEMGQIDGIRLEGFDAVIHLAGESIAEGRWSDAKKKRIYDSRVKGTLLLGKALANLKNPPKVLIVASAIGYFGDRGAETVTESSPRGTGFLPDVCEAWEAAAKPALDKGIRVVQARFGIVLGKNGGALAKMLLPFKMGVGGILGSGDQYMSWIALDDVVGVLLFALKKDSLKGPVNTVAPVAVTNREFTKVLGSVLHRPTIFPAPAFVLRIALGEMADALLLASIRVAPQKLHDAGYVYKFPGLREALVSICR